MQVAPADFVGTVTGGFHGAEEFGEGGEVQFVREGGGGELRAGDELSLDARGGKARILQHLQPDLRRVIRPQLLSGEVHEELALRRVVPQAGDDADQPARRVQVRLGQRDQGLRGHDLAQGTGQQDGLLIMLQRGGGVEHGGLQDGQGENGIGPVTPRGAREGRFRERPLRGQVFRRPAKGLVVGVSLQELGDGGREHHHDRDKVGF